MGSILVEFGDGLWVCFFLDVEQEDGPPKWFPRFETLDLGLVPVGVFEQRCFLQSLRALPRLRLLIIPYHRWGSTNDRMRFVRSLPQGTCVRCVDPRGVVVERTEWTVDEDGCSGLGSRDHVPDVLGMYAVVFLHASSLGGARECVGRVWERAPGYF